MKQIPETHLRPLTQVPDALEMKPMLAELAKLNQGTRTDICQKSDKGLTPIDTRKKLAVTAKLLLAEFCGMSPHLNLSD